jgi:hypothetical protein
VVLGWNLTLSPNSSNDSSGISADVLDYVSTLPLGSHSVFCYDSEQEVAEVFRSYLQGGLERDEAVHIVAPNHLAYKSFAQRAGVDIEPLEEDRRLGCVLISDVLVDKGRLSSRKVFQAVLSLSQEDREFGFKGTRTITPSTEQYYFEYGSPSDLLRYEHELGSNFDLPLSGFCTYNARRLVDLGLEVFLISLFQPHGHIIAKTLAWQTVSCGNGSGGRTNAK